ncbi:dihydroorotate dehydrogenase [Limosilactobacillus fermentum]|uniref:dihydroorotate dehydrogenase n=1 Tax=Limosilactobacillus fermentum TaxID=1613 RepID=UPI00019C62AA|nr:dihydroorotate dehydrogenase [Limosilactobacillus fermentum]EEI21232.1 dihydroorotate oxidase [Limosilactobacillus fermentum ATCC 14931]MCH5402662.1 dihydroorotate dehydrogenase [Limosilactobacillus fermentum]MDC6126298.1 dihydroorotate dehydrogenase [Limosilactobacillus fermentum]MDG9735454.1 dihydroorotate dehydrogenase [Limosilactobacillus fermentum]QCJ27518.1 dihydroorotate dehydrogenase [Limosilactobacillus fermentum]
MTNRLAVSLPGLNMTNPLMPASGTFGFGDAWGADQVNFNDLGALVIKTTTPEARTGNPQPQIAKLNDGVMNAVGLTNPGVDAVIKEKLPNLAKQYPDLPVVGSIGGSTETDYVLVAEKLAKSGLVSALELNVSCPNVAHGGMAFGTDAKVLESLTNQVKRVVGDVPLYVKLTPNVTDITEVARGAEAGGADGLSLINTVLGLHIDIRTGQPVLGNGMGGYSGTEVKPLAVRMVYQVARATKLPIIGMGGIETAADVLEFMMAGASAVAVGAAHFKDIAACPHIAAQLPALMDELGIKTLAELKRI